VRQDRPLELLELLARVEAELLDERAPHVLVGRESIGLAARAVERQHELAAQTLAKRMLGDHGFELADELSVRGEDQVGLDPVLEGREAKLLQAGDLGLSERLVREVGEGGTAPEVERLPQCLRGALGIAGRKQASPLSEEALEAAGIELVRLEVEQIARGTREQARADLLAEARDVDVEEVVGAPRRHLAPQLIHQALRSDDLANVEEQDCEECSRSRAAEVESATVHAHLEWPKDPNIHRSSRR